MRQWIPPVRVEHRASSACCLGADPVVARAQAYIRPRLADALTVGTLARGIGVSRRLVELRFQAVLHRSPYREILRLRMDQAVYLLANTRLKVYEVGMACGFPEPHHFSAVFKRWHGHSPRTCRGEDRHAGVGCMAHRSRSEDAADGGAAAQGCVG